MRTIAIINQKGGCGKTTCAINLAATLATRGLRTLLIDMDPQGHCALGLAIPESRIEHSMADLLRAGFSGRLGFPEIIWQVSRHLDVAPSNISLAGVEQILSSAPDRDRRLMQLLSTVYEQYDICIIDCPPSVGLLTFNALRAADEVLIPVETGYFSMQGAIKQQQTIEMLAERAGHDVRLKVLPTMYDVRTKLAREILAELRRHFADQLLPVVIHFNAKLKEAASFGQPITEYDPASRGMGDFDRLAGWLLAHPPATTFAQRTGTAERSDEKPAPLSRAAELVQRARGLTRRTAELAARLEHDPDLKAERIAPSAPEAEATAGGQATETAQRLDRLYGVRPTRQGLLFVQPAGHAARVSVAGDFNGWDPEATPLERNRELGVWQACIPVPPGRYRYRLVVDGRTQTDPYNERLEAADGGEQANVVEFAS